MTDWKLSKWAVIGEKPQDLRGAVSEYVGRCEVGKGHRE
jgi:hypothetical protein